MKMTVRKPDLSDEEGREISAESCSCVSNDRGRREFLKKTVTLGVGVIGGAMIHEKGLTAETTKAIAGQPPVPIPDVTIFMRSPDAYLVGVSTSEVIEIKLVDVLRFHGYCAGGVAFAFRAAQEAFRVLFGNELPVRQSMKVLTSHHCCQAGALAYITGARSDFGAERSVGDLVLIPKETKKIVFIHKKTGKQVTLRPLFDPHDTFKPMFRRVIDEHDFAPKVQQALRDALQEYINAPVERLFQIEHG
jgi:hypothetical protein